MLPFLRRLTRCLNFHQQSQARVVERADGADSFRSGGQGPCLHADIEPEAGLHDIHRGPWLPALRALPHGVAVAAIGDVHGHADLLAAMHEVLAREIAAVAATQAHLVHLGDLVDRGPQGGRALQLARAGVPGIRSVSLLGNHEERLLQALDDPDETSAGDWLGFGGDAMLTEFAIDRTTGWPGRLRAALGQDLIAWIRAMPRSHRVGDLFFAHAGIDPERPLARQSARDLVWIRRPFLDHAGPYPEEVAVVHGHTPVRAIDLTHPHRINLDTGAYVTGCLSALLVAGGEMRLIQVRRSGSDAAA